MIDEASFLKALVAQGLPVLWFPPQLDGAGNWLPEIEDNGTLIATGTWYGYSFPRWKDPETRTLHEVRHADHVDELLARDPRPAFVLLTGYGVDVIDLDLHDDVRHSDTDYHATMRAAVPHPIAVVRSPTGGEHLHVASDGKHNESNTHSQVDYRGVGGLIALPGTRRSVNGEILTYTAEAWNPENLGVIADGAAALYMEWSAEKRRCNLCSAALVSHGIGHGGIPLGDGSGWDILEEEPKTFDPNDAFGLPTTRELADGVLTWEELLSPWFNVVGRRNSDLYLMRAGKAVEGRDGKSAVLHCSDSRLVAYSSDLPLALGTQLSKLDVFCALKEHESPGANSPDDFAERLKWMRDRWAGLIYSERGWDVPRHLRINCADDKVAKAPPYPVLLDEFWDAHPVLKRIRSEADPRGASPEATLAGVLTRVLLNIGPQVRIPPKSGWDAEEGVTLNTGLVVVGEYGQGKGDSEALAERYVPTKRERGKTASGQSFALLFGRPEKPKKSKDPHDEDALDDGEPKFQRTRWSRYLQYEEMDEFKGQISMHNSTMSPVLRDVLTKDELPERVAIGRDSRLPAVDNFRLVFTAHGQPTRLDWLLIDEASGGFPQRLWYVYAASERPAEEYLDPDYDVPVVEPLELAMPQGWEMPDGTKPERAKVCIQVPREGRYLQRTWQYDSEPDDRRGLLNVRLRAYAAMLVLLPGLSHEEVWRLATAFHDLSYRTRLYCVKLIEADLRRQWADKTKSEVEKSRVMNKAKSEDEIAGVKAQVRARVLELLADGDRRKRQIHQSLSGNRRVVLDEVLAAMENDREVKQEDGKYRLS